MANIQVVCPIVPDELFSYESGQTRYTEQLSFVLLHNIALAAGAAISIQYVSEEEVSSLESAFRRLCCRSGLGLILALRCGLARVLLPGRLILCLIPLCRLRVFFYFVFLT